MLFRSLLLGRASARIGRLPEAIAEFKIAIWIDDRNDARLALAAAYADTDEIALARAETQVIRARDPMNAEARQLADRLDRTPAP